MAWAVMRSTKRGRARPLEAHGVVVDDLHALDADCRGRSSSGQVEHPLEGGFGVLGGEGCAVVKLDPLAQLHVLRRIVDVLPRDGEVGADRARLEVAHGEVIEDLVAKDDGLAKDGAGRIPGVDIGLQRIYDGVVLRLRGPGQGRARATSMSRTNPRAVVRAMTASFVGAMQRCRCDPGSAGFIKGATYYRGITRLVKREGAPRQI